MTINGLTIPDAGESVQYTPDPIGGWVYKVTTTITVDTIKMTDYDSEVQAAQQQVTDAQATLDALTAVQPTVDAAIATNSTAQAAPLTP